MKKEKHVELPAWVVLVIGLILLALGLLIENSAFFSPSEYTHSYRHMSAYMVG